MERTASSTAARPRTATRWPEFPNGRLFGYLARHSVYDTMKARCEAAGIQYIPPHQIGRHTFAMTALRAGKNLRQVQTAGGWKLLAALNRYRKLLPNEEQPAATAAVADALGLAQSGHNSLDKGRKRKAISPLRK